MYTGTHFCPVSSQSIRMRNLASFFSFLSGCFSNKGRKISLVEEAPVCLATKSSLKLTPSEEPSARRRSREEWRQLNEPDLMMELVRDIAQDLDLVSLCFKILLNVGILTNGDRCSLFLIFGSGDQRLVLRIFIPILNCCSEFIAVDLSLLLGGG